MRPQTSASSGVARRIRIPEFGLGMDQECTANVNAAKVFDVMMPAKREKNVSLMRRSVHMKAHLPIAILVLLSIAEAAQQKPEKNNMELVGYNDLQARSAYQPTIHKQGGRWFAYIGHHGGSQMNPLTGKQEN